MRFIKKTASVISSLIIILALGGFVFVRNFDLNKYKSYIEDIVLRETGRELKINGEAKLAISLVPTLVVNDVEFANPDWASTPQMVKLQKLEIKAAILPLLKGRIVVDKLVLIQPEIYLEKAADGAVNWMFTPKSSTIKKAAVVKKTNETTQEVPLLAAGLIAREVEIVNGVLLYSDMANNVTKQLVINDINMSIPNSNENTNINIDAELDGQNITAEINLDNLYSLLNEDKFSFTFAGSAFNVKADVVGSVEDVTQSPRYAAEGSVTNPAGNFGAPAVSAELRVDGDINQADINFKNLMLAGNQITGTAKVNWSKAKPYVNLNLTSPSINVESLTQSSKTAWKMPQLIKQAQALEMVPNEKIPYEYLGLVDADVMLNVARLAVNKDIVLNNVLLNAKLQNEQFNVTKFDAGIGGGNLSATAQVNGRAKTATLHLKTQNMKLQDLQKDLATGNAGSMQVLSGGDLDIDVNLSTSGATYRELAQKASGRAIAIVGKSEIKTGKLSWLASNIFTKLFEILRIDTNTNTNMNMECAVLRSDIGNGKAVFPQGIVFNGSKLKIISSGNINLVNDKIDFTIAPTLNKLADGNIAQALASFVKIEGTLEQPKIRLDNEAALTTIVGSVASGGLYLGSQVLLNGAESPCYTALQGTAYASRFPKPTGVKATTQDIYNDADAQTRKAIKDLGNTAKNLFDAFSGSLGRR